MWIFSLIYYVLYRYTRNFELWKHKKSLLTSFIHALFPQQLQSIKTYLRRDGGGQKLRKRRKRKELERNK